MNEKYFVILDEASHNGRNRLYTLCKGSLDGVGVELKKGRTIKELVHDLNEVYRVYLPRTDGKSGWKTLKS